MDNYEYSSTQFNLNFEDKQEIVNFTKSLIDKDDLLDEDSMEKIPHITIKYGLLTNDYKEVVPIIKTLKSINVILGKTSIFENDEFDVLKIDVLSKELRELNKLISDNLENEDKYLIYKPHLTLAYLKKGMGNKYKNNNQFEGKQIKFNYLLFSSSNNDEVKIYFNDDIEE